MEVTVADAGAVPVRLVALLLPAGAAPLVVDLGPLTAGRHAYGAPVFGCAGGCRLAALGARATAGGASRVDLTVDGDSVAPARLTGALPVPPDVLWLGRAGTPERLAVAGTHGEAVPDAVDGVDGGGVPVAAAATLDALPRVGRGGLVADLEYAVWSARRPNLLAQGEVWLAAGAPPSTVDKLAAAGLAVRDTTSRDELLTTLDRDAGALSRRFHLVAALFAVVLAAGALGLTAAVDAANAGDLVVLRRQGLRRWAVGRALYGGYGARVLLAGLLGLVAGGAAWAVTSAYLPLFADGYTDLPRPRLPDAAAVAGPLAIGLGVLVATAIGSAAWVHSGVERRVSP